jgi:hypothetical protein
MVEKMPAQLPAMSVDRTLFRSCGGSGRFLRDGATLVRRRGGPATAAAVAGTTGDGSSIFTGIQYSVVLPLVQYSAGGRWGELSTAL